MNFFHFFTHLSKKNRAEKLQSTLKNIVQIIKSEDGESFYCDQEKVKEMLDSCEKTESSEDASKALSRKLKSRLAKIFATKSEKEFLLIDGEAYDENQAPQRLTVQQRRMNYSISQYYHSHAHGDRYAHQNQSIYHQKEHHNIWRAYGGEEEKKSSALLCLLNTEKSQVNLEAHQNLLNEGFICWTSEFKNSTNTLMQHTPGQSAEEELESGKYRGQFPLMQFLYVTIYILEEVFQGRVGELCEEYQKIHAGTGLEETRIPTTMKMQILNFTSEQRIELLETIKSIVLNSYTKQNLIGTYNGKKIYSMFSRIFFESLATGSDSEIIDENLFVPGINAIPFCPLRLTESISDYGCGHDFGEGRRHSIFRPGKDEKTPYLPLGNGCGITFINNYLPEVSEYFKELLKSVDRRRITGFLMNSFAKASSKEEFETVSFTKRQATTRKGFFIPTLFPIRYRDENFDIVEGYSFSLLNVSSTYQEAGKKRRSRDQMNNFNDCYLEGSGLYFADREEYERRIKDRLQDLLKYSSSLSTWTGIESAQLNEIVALNSKLQDEALKEMSEIDNRIFDAITSEIKINPLIQKRYTKVKNHFDALLLENTDKSQACSRIASSITDLHIRQKREKNKLETIKAQMLSRQDAIKEEHRHLLEAFNCRSNVIESLNVNKKLYENMEKKYQAAQEIALEEQSFTTTGFFKNLLTEEQILITQIEFVEKKGKANSTKKHIINSKTSVKEKKVILTNKAKFLIEEVNFIINKPVAIKVDAGNKPAVYGVPYLVRIRSHNLHIALAYPNSLFGSITDNYIKIHPHSSRTTKTAFLTSTSPKYQSACLGEAAPLLHSAFKKNDLKSIIMSALIWVKNANSADVWGKDYKFFPQLKDINKEYLTPEGSALDKKTITEDEVEDFIQEMLSENDLEETENVPTEILEESQESLISPPSEGALANTLTATETVQTPATEPETDAPYTPFHTFPI